MHRLKSGYTKGEKVGRGMDLSATKQPVTFEMIVIYGCMVTNFAEDPWITPCYEVECRTSGSVAEPSG